MNAHYWCVQSRDISFRLPVRCGGQEWAAQHQCPSSGGFLCEQVGRLLSASPRLAASRSTSCLSRWLKYEQMYKKTLASCLSGFTQIRPVDIVTAVSSWRAAVASGIAANPLHLPTGRVDFASPLFGLSPFTREGEYDLSCRLGLDHGQGVTPENSRMQQLHFPSYCCGCARMRVARS